MKREDKKLPSISWSKIVMEAILALTNGDAGIDVSSEQMYHWIEATEYLIAKGRARDVNWHNLRYRASLQLCWQKMVAEGELVRSHEGVYRLAKSIKVNQNSSWQELVKIDNAISAPTSKQVLITRIQRSQKLRDGLVNYYQSRCQICENDSPFLIPTQIPERYYVEVHHVGGLAETFALQEAGLLVGFRVNGLGNLTVLCPHHHAMLHNHWPPYKFDRNNLLWRTESGATLKLRRVTEQHTCYLRSKIDTE